MYDTSRAERPVSNDFDNNYYYRSLRFEKSHKYYIIVCELAIVAHSSVIISNRNKKYNYHNEFATASRISVMRCYSF